MQDQGKVVSLFRQAVDQKIALWETLREIEKAVGEEDIDGLEDAVDMFASSVDAGHQVEADSIIKELEPGNYGPLKM